MTADYFSHGKIQWRKEMQQEMQYLAQHPPTGRTAWGWDRSELAQWRSISYAGHEGLTGREDDWRPVDTLAHHDVRSDMNTRVDTKMTRKNKK